MIDPWTIKGNTKKGRDFSRPFAYPDKETQQARFKDKVALITGGTSRIGSGTAMRFSGEGAAVAITGRNFERGEQVVKEITDKGGMTLFIRYRAQEHYSRYDIAKNTMLPTLSVRGHCRNFYKPLRQASKPSPASAH